MAHPDEANSGEPPSTPDDRPYIEEDRRQTPRVDLLQEFEGRLLALDEPQRLQAPLAGQLLEVVADTPRPPVERLARVPGVLDVQAFGDRAHVRIAPGEASAAASRIEAALAAERVRATVRPIAASLEDVFIELIAGTTT